MKKILIVDEDNNGKRLDVFLSENIEDITRSQIKKSIEDAKTLVNGKVSKASKIVKTEDIIDFEELYTEFDILPEDISLNIVYEDEELAVINKKQGMTVHPAPGNYTGTLVNALLYHFDKIKKVGDETRPGIVHRIDKDTSGLLVVAKSNEAYVSLASQIAERKCRRIYYALCEGVFKNSKGMISAPLGRDKKDRKKIAVREDGRIAITHFEVLELFNEYSLIKFELETGRTHQIRVHSKHIGHPIVGDKTYGYAKQKFKLDGQLLHAKQLEFLHPKTKQCMVFESDLPDYFKKILSSLKNIKQ